MRTLVSLFIAALALSAQAGPQSLYLNGRLVRYQISGGYAITQGDLIIGIAANVEAAQGDSAGSALRPLASVLAFDSGQPQKWPNNTMAYAIDADVPNPQRILDGIAHWNSRTPLRIVPRSTEANYVRFQRSTTLDAACASSLGMIGGAQAILTTDGCTTGSVIHELGHAWGLEHEQVRADRNANATVLYQNMDKRFIYNFDQPLTGAKDAGYYDFGSIMHYTSNSFTRSALDTMETVPVGIPIGQRVGLSAGDIDGISRAYGFTPSATTITTVPVGLPITVDGVDALSPQSYAWAAGSTHTITVAAAAQIAGADSRYAFVRWSDGGGLSHTVTAGAAQTVFCATYQTRHSFSQDVLSGLGTVTAFPPSADGYYPDRQPVRVTATPAAGSQFVRWTGTTSLGANGYSVSAPSATVDVLLDNTQYLGVFTTAPLTTIDSVPQGMLVTVDGASALTPLRLAWAEGTTHKIDVAASPYGNNTVRYQFTAWENGATSSARTVTAGGAATYTASFSTQYLLTTSTAGSGAIRVSPSSADGYYSAGATVQLTAVPAAGSSLVYWLGDLGGGTPQQSVTMDDQRDITAYFAATPPFTLFNAASSTATPQFDYVGFAVAPGEIVTVYGANLGPPSPTSAQVDASGNIPTRLAETRVLFDGVPAPVLFTSATQVNVVVPFAIAGQTATIVRTEYNGVQSTGLRIGVADNAPALFCATAGGKGQIAALNQDYSGNSAANPAAPGSVVQLYATGGGTWTESVPDGQITGSHLVSPKAPVFVRVGKLPTEVLYAGTAPGLVNGAMQVNILLPKELIGGPAVPIQVSVGNFTSAPGTTLAVQ